MTATATKSVVWGRYLKGEQAQRGAADYTRYVEHRPGEDRDREGEGKRKFFDRDEKGIDGEKVRELWKEQGGRGPVMHELILSPGLNTVDQQEYTREIMNKLSRAKGQELQWYAAEHKNTDHHHVHVLVAGTDAEGRQVRIGRNDYKQVKEWGDRYLDREHQLDRYLAREADRLTTVRTYEHDRGDELFNKLFSPVHQEHEQEKTAGKSERKEKQLQPEKPAYKVKEWDKDRAIAELPDEDKIYRKNEAFSKYSSLDELKELDKKLLAKEVERATKPEYAQLRQWIKEKERFGSEFHTNTDRTKFDKAERAKFTKREKEREKARDRDDKKQSRESVRDVQEFDKKFREGHEPRQKGDFNRGVGKQQRVHQLYGRTDEVHANYQANLGRQRLMQAMQREPENREQYQKELDWLNESYRESLKDFERLDLDSLFGAKDRDRDQDKKSDKERERQSYEPKDGFNRGVGKQQRVHELYGRTDEVHANHQMNLGRQRLRLAMERDPENKGNYEKELEQLNESYRESLKGSETLDLDSLYPDKEPEKERERGSKKVEVEREPGDSTEIKVKDDKERAEGTEEKKAGIERDDPTKTGEREQDDQRVLEPQIEEPQKETKDSTTSKTQEQRETEEREERERRAREERDDDRGR